MGSGRLPTQRPVNLLADGRALALEASLGEDRWVAAGVVGLEPVAVEHAGGKGEGDVGGLGRDGGVEAGAEEVAGVEVDAGGEAVPRPVAAEEALEVEAAGPGEEGVLGVSVELDGEGVGAPLG